MPDHQLLQRGFYLRSRDKSAQASGKDIVVIAPICRIKIIYKTTTSLGNR